MKNIPFVICLTGVWAAGQGKHNSKMFGIQTHAEKYDEVIAMMKGVIKNIANDYPNRKVLTFVPAHYNKKHPNKWNAAIAVQNKCMQDTWCIKTLNLDTKAQNWCVPKIRKLTNVQL